MKWVRGGSTVADTDLSADYDSPSAPVATFAGYSMHILEADLSLPAHAEATVAMLDAYARDPMGGGAALRTEPTDVLSSARVLFTAR